MPDYNQLTKQVEDQYAKSYEGQKATIDAANQQANTEYDNQQLDIDNKYKQLADSIGQRRTQGLKEFQSQKSSADAVNLQEANKMNQLAAARGWKGGELAQIQLENAARRSNAQGAIAGSEGKYISQIDTEANNANSDKMTKYQQLVNSRNAARKAYELNLLGAQRQSEAGKLGDISKLMEAKAQEEFQAEQNRLQREHAKMLKDMEMEYQREQEARREAQTSSNDTSKAQKDALEQANKDIENQVKKADEYYQRQFNINENNYTNAELARKQEQARKNTVNYINNLDLPTDAKINLFKQYDLTSSSDDNVNTDPGLQATYTLQDKLNDMFKPWWQK
jgi:hypothetical protein